jgi:Icc-related predicted phosphoesterase
MKIDCISDLHGHYPQLEGGDLLIVAGDLTARDQVIEYAEFDYWLSNQHYTRKIIISGNHDNWLQNQPLKKDKFHQNTDYLFDSGTEFEGLKIWGSPWTKTFEGMNPHCKAFTVDTEEELEQKWKNIPYDMDILITHSPPFGVMDGVKEHSGGPIQHCGSLHLFLLLKYAFRPKLHVFGHIHEGYGQEQRFTNCISVNASHVNQKYEPVNKPIRIEL